MLDIQPYVLRYWQTEFPALASSAKGGDAGNVDAAALEMIRRIKELLYDEGYTIASAKKKLAAELEDGKLRGRPLAPDDDETGEPEPSEEVTAEESAEEVAEEAPADESPPVDTSEVGTLTRRVERLEGGVAALVAQARQLAAELKPERDATSD